METGRIAVFFLQFKHMPKKQGKHFISSTCSVTKNELQNSSGYSRKSQSK